MPEKIVQQIVRALKDRFRGDAIEIPIAMKDEPAITIFPGLVEEPPRVATADALAGLDSYGPSSDPLGLPEGAPEASESLSGQLDEDLFATDDIDQLQF